MSDSITAVNSLYDIHIRVHPDGTWGASYQYRQLVTQGAVVLVDRPLDQVPVDSSKTDDITALQAVLGEALTTALGTNTALTAQVADLENQITSLQQQLAAAPTVSDE